MNLLVSMRVTVTHFEVNVFVYYNCIYAEYLLLFSTYFFFFYHNMKLLGCLIISVKTIVI